MRQWHSDLAVRDISTILKRAAGIEETPKSYHGYTNKNITAWGLVKGDWKPISLSEKSMIKPTKIVVVELYERLSRSGFCCASNEMKRPKRSHSFQKSEIASSVPPCMHILQRHPIKRPRRWSLFIPIDVEGIEVWEQEINGWTG